MGYKERAALKAAVLRLNLNPRRGMGRDPLCTASHAQRRRMGHPPPKQGMRR